MIVEASEVLSALKQRGVNLEVRLAGDAPVPDELLAEVREHKPELVALLIAPSTVPRLPWQLERLVRAAAAGVLEVVVPGAPDPSRHVMGWACSYLLGDHEHALARLWQVYQAWEAKAEPN